jgi:hypothetical protein
MVAVALLLLSQMAEETAVHPLRPAGTSGGAEVPAGLHRKGGPSRPPPAASHGRPERAGADVQRNSADRRESRSATRALVPGATSAAPLVAPSPPKPSGGIEAALVAARVGVHQGFERIVFDWPERVGHTITRRGDDLLITFDRAGRIDLSRLPDHLGPRMLAVSASAAGGGAVVLRIRHDAGFRSFNVEGDRVVVDVFDHVGPRAASRREAGPESELVEQLREELRRRDVAFARLMARVEQLEHERYLSDAEMDQMSAGTRGAPGMLAALDAPLPVGALSPPPLAPPAERAQAAAPASAPAAGGDRPVVDEEEAERALDRTLVATGALLLPFGQAEVEPSFSYTRRTTDAPAFVAQNGTTFVGEREFRRNEFNFGLGLLFGLPFDSQLELAYPYQYVNQSTVDLVGLNEQQANDDGGHGFGDFQVGVAKTFLREDGGWWPDLVGRVTYDSDTGKTIDGNMAFGSGFHELSGSLNATKRQDPLAFIGSFSYETAFEKDGIEPGDELGVAIGAILAASPETSLGFVLGQRFVNEVEVDGQDVSGSDKVVGTLTLGASSILGRGVLLDVAGDVGLTDSGVDYAARASLPIRFDLPIY